MGGFSSSIDVSNLAVSVDLDAVANLLADAELDVDTLITRIPAGVALSSSLATAQADLSTLLARITAGVALASSLATAQADLTTLLARITAGVALASSLATAQAGLTTLLARIPGDAATAANLVLASDKLDTLLGRAPEAVATSFHMLALLARVPGEVLQSIKSIQRGQIIWTGGVETSLTATITAVNLAKSILFALGSENSGATYQSFRLGLTNSTTVTATRNGSSGITGSVGFQVVEFN